MPKNLKISLLGQIDIRRDDAPVDNLTGKTLALLGYLAVTTGPHPRPALAGLLWGGMPEAKARGNLSKALSTLRRQFAPHLIITRQTIGFDRDSDYWLDVEAFEVQAQGLGPKQDVEALHQAVELYQGNLLDQLYIRDALEFEQWVLNQRVRLRELALQALYALAAHFAGQGTTGRDKAIAYTARLLRMEPWREEAHREMMLLLAQSGQRGAALAQYETCRQVLADELGVEPGPETTRLYEQIRDGELQVQQPPKPAQDSVPPAIAEPPAAVTRSLHNLPAQPTAFIGRKTELAEITAQLLAPSCRLLTLIGPGGSGKTRLALEAAADALSEARRDADVFEHGVFFVSLAPLQSAGAVVPAVADALGFQFSDAASGAEGTPEQQLLDYLRQKNLLLILDNYEHLLAPPASPPMGADRPAQRSGLLASRSAGDGRTGGGAHLISEILKTAPGIKILATSRARLNVQGEHTFTVAGMAIPGDHLAGAQALQDIQAADSDAVELFVNSARRLNTSFQPTGADLEDVVRVCRLLQGMPLSIVLAAAWVQVLSPGEIADEICQSLDLLETDALDVPDRQRSMRATLDHSWHLLTETERAVMQALSVFHGSFSRQAAQHVSGASLPEMRSLLDKSLVQALPDRRYELHELLRQYAREKLDAAPEAAAVAHERHCATYAAALERWAADLKGGRQAAALAEMRADRENTRAAWYWAVEQLHLACLGQSVEGLCHYYDRRGRWQEGADACCAAAEALAATDESSALYQVGTAASNERTRVLGTVLSWQGVFTLYLGRTETARQLLRQGLNLLEELPMSCTDTRADRALALYSLSGVATHSGDDPTAARLREQSLALYREAGDEWGTALVLGGLSFSARDSGAYEEAKRLAKESLALRRAICDAWGTANALTVLGWIAQARGEHEEAERCFRESIGIHRETGHRGTELVGGLFALSSTLIWIGKYREAHALAQEALDRCADTGNLNQFPWASRNLGEAKLHLGHYADARAQLQKGLNVLQETGETRFLVATLAALGGVALALETHPDVCGYLEERITLAGEVEGWRVNYELTVGLTVLAYAALRSGKPDQAREYLAQALRPAMKTRNSVSLIQALAAAALMSAAAGKSAASDQVRAVELYALLYRYPHVANSRWYEDVVGKQITAIAKTLPADVVAAAQERGKTRDLWETAEELLEELEG